MINPAIAIGGTSPSSLYEKTNDALDAARSLLAALIAMSPNPRDYVCAQDYFFAQNEMQARTAQVEILISELQERQLFLFENL